MGGQSLIRFSRPQYLTNNPNRKATKTLKKWPFLRSRFPETHGGRGLAAGIDDGKAGRIQAARRAVLVVGKLELAVARAEHDHAAPGQRRIALPDRPALAVDRFGVAVESVWIAPQVRPQALAGRHPIPAAGNDRAHFDDAERGHHRVFGVVAPGEAGALRIGGG